MEQIKIYCFKIISILFCGIINFVSAGLTAIKYFMILILLILNISYRLFSNYFKK